MVHTPVAIIRIRIILSGYPEETTELVIKGEAEFITEYLIKITK